MDGTTKRPINGNSGKKPKRTSRKATSVPKKSIPRGTVNLARVDSSKKTRPIWQGRLMRERIRRGSMWNWCRSAGLGNPQNHSWGRLRGARTPPLAAAGPPERGVGPPRARLAVFLFFLNLWGPFRTLFGAMWRSKSAKSEKVACREASRNGWRNYIRKVAPFCCPPTSKTKLQCTRNSLFYFFDVFVKVCL